VPAEKEVALKLPVVTPPVVLTFTGLPELLPSIMNWTVPVGAPRPGEVTLMVAVKVTLWPTSDGLAEDTTAVVVAALPTVWVTGVEPLSVKLASPL
jgi:hypothetical protein